MKYNRIYFNENLELHGNASADTSYPPFVLNVVISASTGRIEAVDCTLMPQLAGKMARSYFIGRNIIADFEEMVEEVAVRHQDIYNEALIKAIDNIRKKYISLCAQAKTSKK